MGSACLNDDSLGPGVRGCRGDFDFTMKFERVFFSILPASIFVALSIPRIVLLSQRPRIVGATWFQFLKLAVATVYSTLQFSLLVLLTTSIDSAADDNLAIASAALTLAAGLAILPLSFFEHARSPRPSSILAAYVALTLLFDAAQARTSWLSADSLRSTIFARLFTASIATKLALLLIESRPKTRWLRWDVASHSPEETSGLFGLGVFLWLNALFLRGYRSVLQVKDLYALDANMLSSAMHDRLAREIQKHPLKGKKHGLAKVLARALAVPLLLPIPARVARIGFTFCQPLFISALLDHLQRPDSSDPSTRNDGYGLIGACALIFTGLGFSNALYQYYVYRGLYMARGCLAAAVYRATTTAKISSDDGGDDAAAVTLMSTDVERIVRGFYALHEFWASIIEVAIGCWLLQRQLGLAFLTPLVVILVCVGATALISRRVGKAQREWMAKIQKRVGLTANVIANMKNLRISGISGPVAKFIQGLRVDEIDTGNKWRMLLIATATVAFLPGLMAPVLTFAVTSATIDVTRVFTSLSYLILVTSPFALLFQSVPNLLAGFTCLERIQAFLEAEPRVDYRDGRSKGTSGLVSSFREKDPELQQPDHVDSVSEKQSVPLREIVSEPSGPQSIAASITHGSFGWSRDTHVLRDISISIPSAGLTIVVGPVASGKSTLCKALLGEVTYATGIVNVSTSRDAIGYCEQSPFLSNATLKENIVGYTPFSQTRYDDVVAAAMLVPDVALLPSGDDTKIGSNGIMLSGGQKQRVSLARALYLESDFLILDDILSGLDNDTASEVFRRTFGPEGLLRQRKASVVLCTHSVRYLPWADHVIALGADGAVVEQGTFVDLAVNGKYVQGLGVKAVDSDSNSETSDRPPSAVAIKPAIVPTDQDMSLALDDRARQTGDIKVYVHYFSTIRNSALILSVVVGVLWGVFQNLPTVWLNYWAEDTFHRSSAFYIGMMGLYRSIQLVAFCITGRLIFMTFIKDAGSGLHEKALSTVVSAPLRFFTTTDSGIVTNLFSQDMTLIDSELPNSLINILLDGWDLLGMAAVIAVASPYMAISYPFLFLIVYVLQKFYLRTSRQLRLLDLEAKSPLYTHFIDTIKGVATIRAFGWVAHDIVHNDELLDTSQRPAYLLAMIQQWLNLTLRLTVTVIAIVLTTLATQLRTSSGFTGASFVTLMSFGESIGWIIQFYTLLETSIGAVARLKTFSERVLPEDLPGEDVVPPEEWPQNGLIEIKGVSASYSSASRPGTKEGDSDAESPNLALKNLTLTIRPGEKVAICGRTGSGKSSLILLLLKLLEPLASCSQNIWIDGVPSHRLDRATLRRRIIAVPQDAVFLPDGSSVKANLDPWDAASDEECMSVLAAAQLSAFVESRGGLRGAMTADSLSAGQKQLFSLARAILRRRVRGSALSVGEQSHGGVLLLDEVSSSVDQETDRTMQEIIKDEFAAYTIVMVSHRLDMVVDYFDRAVVMDRGAVVESGAPKELVEREGSRFGELWVLGNHG